MSEGDEDSSSDDASVDIGQRLAEIRASKARTSGREQGDSSDSSDDSDDDSSDDSSSEDKDNGVPQREEKKNDNSDDDDDEEEENEEEEDQQAQEEDDDDDITCDVCGVDCVAESYFMVEGDQDICPKCYEKDKDKFKDAEHQKKGEKWDEPAEGEDGGKPPQWRNSKARDYLYKLLVDNKLPDRTSIKPLAVYEQWCKDRPEFIYFQDYKELKFASKLLYLRNKAKERGDRSKEDAEAFAHDRKIFPAHTVDTKGRPAWPGSKAQALLREDLKAKKHLQVGYKPKKLYYSKEEYWNVYDLDFFREKIYQEVKAAKRLVWVIAKSEKKKKKKK